MKKSATFTIGKDIHKVSVDAPDNLCEAIGHARASQLLMSFGIAHWVQSKVKSAFKLLSDEEALKKANQSTQDAAKALYAKVCGEEPLEFMQFVPAPKGEDKVVAKIREKWEGSKNQAAFLKSMGLDAALEGASAQEVIDAYLAKEEDDVEL